MSDKVIDNLKDDVISKLKQELADLKARASEENIDKVMIDVYNGETGMGFKHYAKAIAQMIRGE